MSSSQQVRLRWTTHQGTLVAVLQSLLGKNCLVDVTLAAEGKYVRAHKVILCACSPYFEELLSISEDKHPIILLQDVKYVELQALISYMYWGEVNIDEENLPSLLRIAEALQIRGLFGSSPSPPPSNTSEEPEEEDEPIVPIPIKHEHGVTSDFETPVPKKSRQANQGTTSNSSSSQGKSEDVVVTNSNSKTSSTSKETIDCCAPEVNSNHSNTKPPSPTPTPATNKRSTKSGKHARAVSPPTPPVECILNRDSPSESEMIEPSASFRELLENYFSHDDDKDDLLAPGSPPPDDEDGDPDGMKNGNGTDQIFRCIKCGKRYTSNKSLWRHRKFACEGKQTFACQLCGKSFSRSDNLRRHAVVAHCIQ